MKSSLRQFAVVFCLWTLVALADGLNAYGLGRLLGDPPPFWSVFRHPLVEQWLWALLTPIVFLVAHRFPLVRPRLARAIGVHAGAFIALSLLHCALAQAVGVPLPDAPAGFTGPALLLRFFNEFYSDIWMYWPLVCIQALLDSRARLVERETRTAQLEGRLANTQLALLRAQIQPHFLFNTLHSISALLRIDPRAAEDMVADLAEILRTAFSGSVAQETTLRRELELVRCYLRIQQCRLGDRMHQELDIAQQALDATVPTLLLQSLVENAVIHGVAPLNRPVRLLVRATVDDDRLQLVIDDNGVGLAPDFEAGVGIANARERLQQLYGDAQSFAIEGSPGRGTTVRVSLPYRICGEAAAATGNSHEDSHADRGRRAAGAAQSVVTAGS